MAPPFRPDSNLGRAAGVAWRALVVAIGVYVVVVALARLRLVVLPVIVAVLLATVLVPPVQWLQGRGVPRLLATWVVLLGSITILVLVVVLLAPSVREEFADLGPTLGEARVKVEDWLVDGPLDLSRQEVDDLIDDAASRLQDSSDQIASGVLAGAALAAEVIAGILLTLVLVFFFVKDGPGILGFFRRQVGEQHHDLLDAIGRRAWRAASGYVQGTAIVAMVDAVIIGIGLAVIGVPLVLPLAALTFFGGFFPLVGATLAGAVAALVGLVDGGLTTALLVIGVVVVVQQVEGDVLQPVVMGRAVSLHPIVILVALTAGGVLGGVIGAFLAVPVSAVVVAVGSELRQRGVIGPDRGAERPSLPEPASDA